MPRKYLRDENGSVIETKQIVLRVIEHDGKVALKHIKSASTENMVPFIEKIVQVGTRIVTDEARVYGNLNKKYADNKVNHTLKVYV
jgi:hypothetical protein